MRYAVLLEPVQDPEFEGFYYVHIPRLDLTTHAHGVEGALAAARELAAAWIAEKQSHGEALPPETTALMGQIEVPDATGRPDYRDSFGDNPSLGNVHQTAPSS